MIDNGDMRYLLAEESGTTSIEYALIGSLVSVAIIGSLTALAGMMRSFDAVWAALVAAAM